MGGGGGGDVMETRKGRGVDGKLGREGVGLEWVWERGEGEGFAALNMRLAYLVDWFCNGKVQRYLEVARNVTE